MTTLAHVLVLAAVGAATPAPAPEPVPGSGPGIVGFLVTFGLVLACIPLFLSMTRKVRGVRYRDEAVGAPPDGATAQGAAGSPPPGAAPDDAAGHPRP